MRKIKAQTVRKLAQEECARREISFSKGVYRSAKRIYNRLSWIERTKVV